MDDDYSWNVGSLSDRSPHKREGIIIKKDGQIIMQLCAYEVIQSLGKKNVQHIVDVLNNTPWRLTNWDD